MSKIVTKIGVWPTLGLGGALAAGVGSLALFFARPDGEEVQRCLIYSHEGDLAGQVMCLVEADTPAGRPSFLRGMGSLVVPLRYAGRELTVAAHGCGLLRHRYAGEAELTLPAPVSVVVAVEADFEIPRAGWGIVVELRASGALGEHAEILNVAVASNDYWAAQSLSPERAAWVDPATRTAKLLVPCCGEWSVRWACVSTSDSGDAQSLSVVYATGEASTSIVECGQVVELSIPRSVLDRVW